MPDRFEARAPDYNLAMLVGDKRNPSVGSGWTQPDKSITIKLHPGVVLQAGPTVKLRLFPKDSVPGVVGTTRKPPASFDDMDDIPF
jgi:hypothetical protein